MSGAGFVFSPPPSVCDVARRLALETNSFGVFVRLYFEWQSLQYSFIA